MSDESPPTHSAGPPWGPAPVSPPVRGAHTPVADPFATMGAPAGPPPQRRGRSGFWLGFAAVLGAAVVVAGLGWWSQRETTDEAASEASSSDETAASPGEVEAEPEPEDRAEAEPRPEPEQESEAQLTNAVCPGGTPVEVCDAARFVEDLRGRPFQTFPVVEFEADDEFERRLLEDVDAESIEETRVRGEVLGSLGLVPPGTDLVDVTELSLELGVVGFYDPVTKELVVRGSEIDPFVELVIVHELVHAHDDQWLDLDRPELDDTDDESFVGFLAVVEGNASRVEDIWRSQLPADKQRELSDIELGFYGPDEIAILQQIPRFVLETQFFPYQDGPLLVRAIAADAGGGEAGERAIDEAILNPPLTSEQALHPDQYLARGEVPSVPAPVASGEIIDEGVIGELVLDIWFGDAIGTGWNGDRYVSFERDDQVCTVIHVAADTATDLDEIFDSAADWVGDAADGDLRRSDQVTVDGVDLVIIEGCR